MNIFYLDTVYKDALYRSDITYVIVCMNSVFQKIDYFE